MLPKVLGSGTLPGLAQPEVKVGGRPIDDAVLRELARVTVDSISHLPDMALLEFLDTNYDVSDLGTFKIGRPIEIGLGDIENVETVFKGEIVSIEVGWESDGDPTLLVRAYDRGHRLQRGRNTKTWLKAKDSDIASDLAGEVGLSADVDVTQIAHEYVLQHNQTNWEFLQERARRIGYEMYVDDRRLVFAEPPSTGNSIPLTFTNELARFRARMTAGEQVDTVIVRGWDPLKKEVITGEASTANVGEAIDDSRTGASVANRAFGAAELTVVRENVRSPEEAEAIAQAVLDEVADAFVVAEGVATGNPELRVGATVEIDSFGDRFSGEYVLTEVRHVYGARGYHCEFKASGRRYTDVLSLLKPNDAPPVHLLVGTVTDVNDKDQGLARVKVGLNGLGDVETDWCRVVSPGAGPERGIEFLPEVEDEVLLLGADMHELFVLGGLWNQKDKPPTETPDTVKNGDVNKRSIRTRTGHLIEFDDSDQSPQILIVDKTGKNQILINSKDNKIEVTADGDMKFAAKGKIELEAGSDLDLNSTGGSLSVKATSNVSLEATSTLTLKGVTASLEGTGSASVKAPNVTVGP